MWKTTVKHKNYRAGLKGTKLTLGRFTNHHWMKKWFGNLRTILMMTVVFFSRISLNLNYVSFNYVLL
ncbi:hypothetical protein HanIR_Chr10g0456651 [Helianthus annuus]|nr:hypothetical protein HanIR_Chr10g0456651 [Helianthus annuus]